MVGNWKVIECFAETNAADDNKGFGDQCENLAP